MGIYTEAIQKLYVAYFSRPADPAGLTYWEGVVTAAKGSTAAVSAAFAASAEYKAAYAGLDAYHVVDQVYMNLFGRHAEPAGLQFWGQNLIAGKITIDAVVTAVATGAQGADLISYNSKVAAATAFTAALDTSAEILGYSGAAANGLAASFIAGITDAATLAAAIAPAALDATIVAVTNTPVVGVTTTLTTGVDDFVGTAGNDTINAFTAAGAIALGTFDNINGGGGTDTLNFVDTIAGPTLTLPTTATIGGIEAVSITTVNAVNVDTSVISGVNKLSVKAAGAGGVATTVSNGTDVTIQTAAAGAAAITVAGGKSVTIAASNAAAGDVSVTGTALSAVKIAGGANVTVDNTGGDPVATAKGTTLTAVSVDGTTGGTIAVKGAGITTLNLSNMAQTVAANVTNATAAHALNVNLELVDDLTVTDAITTAVTVNTVDDSAMVLVAAKATTVTLAGEGALDFASNAANVKLKTINGAAATGDLTLSALGTLVTTVTTGSGDDDVTISALTKKDDTTTTSVDETIGATVTTGAGDDIVEVALDMTSTGVTTIATGEGDDEVALTTRGATDILNIDMGAGSDTLLSTGVSLSGTDKVNAGDGVDTLTLKLVGSANIGAFSNFELFDAVDMTGPLDVDILASKNQVTEIIASGSIGTGSLLNLGAGVGARATADMMGTNLSLTQKVAGAITVTADMDEATAADDAIDVFAAAFTATNATSINVVFGTDYKATRATETTAGDNVTTMTVVGGAATAATVVAGGTLANDVLVYNDTNGKLAALTVTGTQALNLTVNNGVPASTATAVANLDASAHTGGLTVSTASLKDLGVVKLGSGVDAVTVAATSTSAAFESVSGMEKAAAAAVGTDATAKAAAIADADTLFLGAAVDQANANAGVTTGTIAKGVLTFTGAGPATLAAAFAIADLAAETVNEAVVFNYLGDSFVFVQGGATDLAVKLVGTTGITNFVESGTTGSFFIV